MPHIAGSSAKPARKRRAVKQGRRRVTSLGERFQLVPGRVVLADVVEAGVAANLNAGLVLGLVHDLAVLRPVEFGNGHKRGAEGVRRIVAA